MNICAVNKKCATWMTQDPSTIYLAEFCLYPASHPPHFNLPPKYNAHPLFCHFLLYCPLPTMYAGHFFGFGVDFVSPFVFWICISFGETTLVCFGFSMLRSYFR